MPLHARDPVSRLSLPLEVYLPRRIADVQGCRGRRETKAPYSRKQLAWQHDRKDVCDSERCKCLADGFFISSGSYAVCLPPAQNQTQVSAEAKAAIRGLITVTVAVDCITAAFAGFTCALGCTRAAWLGDAFLCFHLSAIYSDRSALHR